VVISRFLDKFWSTTKQSWVSWQPSLRWGFIGRLSLALNGLPRNLHPQHRAPQATKTSFKGSQADFGGVTVHQQLGQMSPLNLGGLLAPSYCTNRKASAFIVYFWNYCYFCTIVLSFCSACFIVATAVQLSHYGYFWTMISSFTWYQTWVLYRSLQLLGLGPTRLLRPPLCIVSCCLCICKNISVK